MGKICFADPWDCLSKSVAVMKLRLIQPLSIDGNTTRFKTLVSVFSCCLIDTMFDTCIYVRNASLSSCLQIYIYIYVCAYVI